MSTFGKALVGVNVVLAFAFVFLAATDYSRRRGWENLILQQDLTINGLAIDEKEKDAEGQLIYQLAGKNMQQQLGVTTSTQVEELRKRHDQIKSAIDGAANGAAKKAEVVKYVLPLARNTVEYYLIATGNPAEFAAESPLLTKVMGQDGPLESGFAAGNKTDAYDVRRDAIAFFLFNTSVEPADYQRTLGVVGLAAYARALEGQGRVRGADHPLTLWTLWKLAELDRDRGRLDQADAMFRRCIEGYAKAQGDEGLGRARLRADLAMNHLKKGEPGLAEPLLREALKVYDRQMKDDWRRFEIQGQLGEALGSQKKYDEAEPLVLGGHEGLANRREKVPVDARPRLPEAGRRVVSLYESWGRPEQAASWKGKLLIEGRRPMSETAAAPGP